jgi:formamidopyrimidine-DNA glycosylase
MGCTSSLWAWVIADLLCDPNRHQFDRQDANLIGGDKMIELPEALVIARQMSGVLAGRRITYGNRGNTPHKFAFSSGSSAEYEEILEGKRMGETKGHGSAVLASIEPGYVLVLGGGGERILYHQDERTLPKKHHLLLHFEDGTYLTVTVQGWGNTLLLPQTEAGSHPHVQKNRIPPLDDAFTWDYFHRLFDLVDEDSATSVKYFVISDPGVWGIGNGCLQDILFRAKIHPRRRVVDVAEDEQRALYDAVRDILTQMVALGGRESECDLYGNRGGYVRILDSKTAGQPCPECGTPIEKIQYLGGACYLCPSCQT